MSISDSVALYAIGHINKERHPQRIESRCLNIKQRISPCTQCVDACPAHINLLSESPSWLSCKSCNHCVAVCPSGAMEPSILDMQLTQYVKDLSGDCIVLSCEEAKEDADVRVNCLSRLTWEQIATLALTKKVVLKVGVCKTCNQTEDVCIVRSNVRKLREFFGKDAFDSYVSLTVPQGAHRPLNGDRQQLQMAINSCKRGAWALVQQSADEYESTKEAPISSNISKEIPSHVSVQRAMLLDALAASQAEDTFLYTHWNTFEIGPDCTGCGICVKLCPSCALCIEQKEDGYVLIHNSSACSECGLCYVSCPKDCIGQSYVYTSSQLPAKVENPIDVVACEKCGRLFKPEQDETRCKSCSRMRFSPY